MMNKLKNRRWGLFRNWTVISGRWLDLNAGFVPGVLSRGFRYQTVKTSLLKQRCKTILKDASDRTANF
jgi:hypothetical protein